MDAHLCRGSLALLAYKIFHRNHTLQIHLNRMHQLLQLARAVDAGQGQHVADPFNREPPTFRVVDLLPEELNLRCRDDGSAWLYIHNNATSEPGSTVTELV